MNSILKAAGLSARIWILGSLVFGAGCVVYALFLGSAEGAGMSILATVCAAFGSLPVLLALLLAVTLIEKQSIHRKRKITLLTITSLLCTLPYGFIGGSFFAYSYENDNWWNDYLLYSLGVSAAFMACATAALILSRKQMNRFFSALPEYAYSSNQNTYNMETEQPAYILPAEKAHSNKTLIKGIITGVLILVMMIPTLFVQNLVREREQRQKEVVREVSSRWASDQTLAGPYIYIPYTIHEIDKDKKPVVVSKHLLLLPNNLNISGSVTPEIRPRSIYKVLLYKSNLKASGNFVLHLPREIDPASLQLQDAKICFGITDFKGIEEKISVNINSTAFELSPGLPVNDIDEHGLSSPLNLTVADIGKPFTFDMQVKIKGSEQLHFIPLSGNSQFSLQSSWNNPSFDGNNLPGERNVDDKGFSAKWTFNKANLPFGTLIQDNSFDKKSFAFGVSMLQPADQYAKTTRSVKYAILFIGLTFSLFFIIELMQKKPVHPVQYVLVGLALVIFYTLLLSVSEFILFDLAYLIASLATISLITLYAKSHFQSWKTASLFGGILCGLYGFIFILIRLEDTALLVGSIGLFLVLALVMYGSRKINWYQSAGSSTVIA